MPQTPPPLGHNRYRNGQDIPGVPSSIWRSREVFLAGSAGLRNSVFEAVSIRQEVGTRGRGWQGLGQKAL